jgi:phosphopantetheinyl transferase
MDMLERQKLWTMQAMQPSSRIRRSSPLQLWVHKESVVKHKGVVRYA